MNRNKLIILSILLLALFLRIYDLGSESLWIDEGFSIRVAKLNLVQIIEQTSWDTHPPLHFIILHCWINIFGDSEFSTRFLSVIFGFFAIFMMYRVGTLIFNKNTGILASLLLSVSVFHIHYSQEVRMYGLMALLALCSMYFFIKLLEERNYTTSISYIVFSTLLMYTHVYGFFIIIAQNIYLLTLFLLSKEEYKLNFRRWILFQLLLVVLYIPWINILINQILQVQSGFWIHRYPLHTQISYIFIKYSGSLLLLLFFLLLSPISTVSFERIKGNFNRKNVFKSIESYSWNVSFSNANSIYLLLVWLFTLHILPFIISQFSAPIYLCRCTIAASLAFYILIARGIENINNKYIKIITIILVIGFSLGSVGKYYTEVNKEQWREVANYIDLNAEKGDLLLFNAGFCIENVFDYYSKRTDLKKKPFPKITEDMKRKPFRGRKRAFAEKDINELGPTVKGYNRTWLVLCHNSDQKGLIKEALSEFYNLSYHKEYVGVNEYASIDLSLFIKSDQDNNH